jgi:hypothetical protein
VGCGTSARAMERPRRVCLAMRTRCEEPGGWCVDYAGLGSSMLVCHAGDSQRVGPVPRAAGTRPLTRQPSVRCIGCRVTHRYKPLPCNRQANDDGYPWSWGGTGDRNLAAAVPLPPYDSGPVAPRPPFPIGVGAPLSALYRIDAFTGCRGGGARSTQRGTGILYGRCRVLLAGWCIGSRFLSGLGGGGCWAWPTTGCP